jgi:6-phosphofructokinase 1
VPFNAEDVCDKLK